MLAKRLSHSETKFCARDPVVFSAGGIQMFGHKGYGSQRGGSFARLRSGKRNRRTCSQQAGSQRFRSPLGLLFFLHYILPRPTSCVLFSALFSAKSAVAPQGGRCRWLCLTPGWLVLVSWEQLPMPNSVGHAGSTVLRLLWETFNTKLDVHENM